MKKNEKQFIINSVCMDNYYAAMDEITTDCACKKLRYCQACVIETDHYYILRSYRTIVAVIDKETDVLYDVLRWVYGYTSTSAQHISKFEKDYCKGKWSCADRLTYRSL